MKIRFREPGFISRKQRSLKFVLIKKYFNITFICCLWLLGDFDYSLDIFKSINILIVLIIRLFILFSLKFQGLFPSHMVFVLSKHCNRV